MIIEYLKDGKKMLTNKILYTTNISSNVMNFSANSSTVPNTLFELMKTNILIVDDNNSEVPSLSNEECVQDKK